MARLHVAGKVWLSIGIFIVGFGLFAALAQIEGADMESRLDATSRVLHPAALQSQEAEAVFQQSVKGFGDAVLTLESVGLQYGETQGSKAIDCLRRVSSLSHLAPERATSASELAADIQTYLIDARNIYGRLVANSANPTDFARARELANRTAELNARLHRLKEGFTQDLQHQLATLRKRSVSLRWTGLLVLVSTLLIAAVLVNWTIQRVIATPLMAAEAELAHERDLLRTLIDNIPDCIYFKDTASRFVRINRAQSKLLGIDDERLAYGLTDFSYFSKEHAQQAHEDERELVGLGKPLISRIECIPAGKGQDERWMTSTKVAVRDQDGRITGIVGITRDITEWKRAVAALEKSKESFQMLFAAIPHPVWVYDVETYKFLEVNDAAIRDYGYSEQEFKEITIHAVHSGNEIARLARFLQSSNEEAPSGGWRFRTKNGEEREAELSCREFSFAGRRCILAVVQDVSEKKRLEMELHQAQRLESVGQLAAGIAHEINTPIQYVGDNLRFIKDAYEGRQKVLAKYAQLRQQAEAGNVSQAALKELGDELEQSDFEYVTEEIPKALDQSLDGVERVATIVRAMKEFAHPGNKEKAAADINRALQSALVVARNELKYVADVETDLGEIAPVVCHIADINQVFLNLLVNAAHAIELVTKDTGKRGMIRIRSRQIEGRVEIAISDSGCGIPKEIQAKVFDPFFTTKEVGRGTGQGLAIARSTIVEKHGGTLTFEPNGNQGTTFKICIPLEPVPVSGLRERGSRGVLNPVTT